MGLEVKFNYAELETRLTQLGERAVKGASDKMRRRAIKIRDLARDYAPEDTGSLMRAIDWTERKDGKRRNQFIVFLDPSADSTPGPPGKTVGDYGLLVERYMAPYGYGSLNGRPFHASEYTASAMKPDAGGRFMMRAFKEVTKNLEQEVAMEVRAFMGGGQSSIRRNATFNRGSEE